MGPPGTSQQQEENDEYVWEEKDVKPNIRQDNGGESEGEEDKEDEEKKKNVG